MQCTHIRAIEPFMNLLAILMQPSFIPSLFFLKFLIYCFVRSQRKTFPIHIFSRSWKDGLDSRGTHPRLFAVQSGFESRPSYKLSPQCFASGARHQCACRPSVGRQARGPVYQHWSLADDKKIPVSFLNSQQVIAGNLAQFEKSALVCEGICLAKMLLKQHKRSEKSVVH